MKKTAEVLESDDPGGGAFALFLRAHPGALGHPWEFAHFFFKYQCPGGKGTAGID